jgi:hypothetical protein
MKTYKVIIKPADVTEPGSLQFLSRITDDYRANYIDTDENSNEIHEVEVGDEMADWVERQLDLSDGVVSYEEI